MNEVLMIRKTVRKIGKQLESLSQRNVPISRAFDILSRKAGNIEEVVVVEVMREVYQEILDGEMILLAHAEPTTRTARIPSMALSR